MSKRVKLKLIRIQIGQGWGSKYSKVPNNSAARLLIFKKFSLPTRLIWTYTLIKIQTIFLPTRFKLVCGPFGQSKIHKTSQEGIECTKIKEWQRSYCPDIYTVVEGYLGRSENLLEYRITDILPDEPKMSPEWIFMPLIYCNDVEEVSICSSCEKYIIKGIQTFS